MISSLPTHLRERSRVVLDHPIQGEFVLYWMRTAVRADENPALDVARIMADENGVPLLVYHGLSENYPYASDRHHTFMLQGARDAERQLTRLGISYVFHLATATDRRPHLVELARKAALVVTEEMPVDPPRRYLDSLTRQTETAIVCVDTACVVPMQLVKRPYTRAFQYRGATEILYAERLAQPWPEVACSDQPFEIKSLPFGPADLKNESIAELVSRCEIDHAIGPVIDTIGGSTAGYRRWDRFKSNGLSSYARRRNNALVDGVSRMSPYLHYGMVSPFRIAREASQFDNAGAEKYLDELLIWREMAYAFCFHRSDHDQWSALPEWARKTLDVHAVDPRERVYSWEQLARGETENLLWNAAQKSLLVHGELHNNVRMTWGKAILNWTSCPRQALQMIIDLNHRYALDGRDPASYGGILWCLGQFDRPFEPALPIIGTVRPRPTAGHANRLDPQEYMNRVTAPRFDPIPHVAVIGAGLSGVFAARTLADHGLQVTVFEKSRGVGGRMATRRLDNASRFDHGAQYFTARDSRFRRYVDSWIEQGVVAAWPDQPLGEDQKIVVLKNGQIESESSSEQRFVGVPAMNSVCRHLAGELDIRTEVRVTRVEPSDRGITLLDDKSDLLGSFDRLIVSAPAEQTAELLIEFPRLHDQVAGVKMNPCWATMIQFANPITDDWVGAFLHDSFLAWAARNNTKPGRACTVETLVLHATPEWTVDHLDNEPEAVALEMLNEFWRAAGSSPQTPVHLQAHRWKFAIARQPAQVHCFFDNDAGIAACGDWASGSRVEGAFLSGLSAAGRILGTLAPIHAV
jgi:photolyase PhrII